MILAVWLVLDCIASGESDANDEATDPGVIPLAIGLDKVYLTSF
jgi:hypothetical protein